MSAVVRSQSVIARPAPCGLAGVSCTGTCSVCPQRQARQNGLGALDLSSVTSLFSNWQTIAILAAVVLVVYFVFAGKKKRKGNRRARAISRLSEDLRHQKALASMA